MKKRPWERRDDETEDAFAAFEVYRDMAPTERSARLVEETLSSKPVGTDTARRADRSGKYTMWCHRYGWVERSRAHDDYESRIKLDAADREMLATMRAALKEHNAQTIKLARLAYKRIEEMLALPTTRQTINREVEVAGQKVAQTITIEPVNWKPSDAAALVTALDKVLRLSTGDVTERVENLTQATIEIIGRMPLAGEARETQRAALLEIAERTLTLREKNAA